MGKEQVLTAANIYCALLSSQGPFPTSSEELKLSVVATLAQIQLEAGAEQDQSWVGLFLNLANTGCIWVFQNRQELMQTGLGHLSLAHNSNLLSHTSIASIVVILTNFFNSIFRPKNRFSLIALKELNLNATGIHLLVRAVIACSMYEFPNTTCFHEFIIKGLTVLYTPPHILLESSNVTFCHTM